jgi:hypothetical protein
LTHAFFCLYESTRPTQGPEWKKERRRALSSGLWKVVSVVVIEWW